MKMWLLIFLIGTCSALSVEEHWRYVSENGTELRRGIYGIYIKKNTLWDIAPMAVASEPGRIIDLSNLNIKEIRNNVFDRLANVTVLNLANNELENIPPLIFGKLKTLKTLSLADNELRTFDRCFVGLRNLKSLDLSNNLIESLTTGDLLGLPKSVNLITTGNPLKKFAIYSGESSLPYFVPSELDRNPWSSRNTAELSTIMEMTDIEPVVKMWNELEEVPADNPYRLAWSSYTSKRLHMKLCKSNDGVVESLNVAEEGEALGDCQVIPRVDPLYLSLSFLGIKKFNAAWYLISMDLFETLSLSSNKISYISPTFFDNFPNSIISVNLDRNHIRRIETRIIRNKFLKEISFAYNSIESVADGAFEETNLVSISFAYNRLENSLNFIKTLPTSIQKLILTGNGISIVPEDFIRNLTALRYFEIGDNHIYHLSANTFRGLKKLQKIDLSRNSLGAIEPETFKDQEELLNLELYDNKIKEITPGIFNGLKNIRLIALSSNGITRITKNSFSGLRNLVMVVMDLTLNKIDTIEEGSFSHMTIKELDLGANNISEKSVAKGAFDLCTLYEILYDSNPLKNISGDGFDGLLLYKENRFLF